MHFLDEEFDMLGKNKLALLTRRVEKLHENRLNTRRTARICYQCGKLGHFVAYCLKKMENKDDYKHQSMTDNKHRSRRDHKHKHRNKDEQ
jgi:hypothetical protein